MKKLFLGLTLLTACTAMTPQPAVEPIPNTTTVQTSDVKPGKTNATSTGLWSFSYTPGIYSYRITTDATVRIEGDSQNQYPPIKREQVTFQIGPDSTVIVEPAIEPGITGCGSQNSALRVRASELLPELPQQLASGATWNDSITTNGCFKTSPTVSTWFRNFLVEGKTSYEGRDAILVKRISKVAGKGETIEGQHRILINAHGDDSTNLFIDPSNGRFLGSVTSQVMNITVTASARDTTFKQSVIQKIKLID